MGSQFFKRVIVKPKSQSPVLTGPKSKGYQEPTTFRSGSSQKKTALVIITWAFAAAHALQPKQFPMLKTCYVPFTHFNLLESDEISDDEDDNDESTLEELGDDLDDPHNHEDLDYSIENWHTTSLYKHLTRKASSTFNKRLWTWLTTWLFSFSFELVTEDFMFTLNLFFRGFLPYFRTFEFKSQQRCHHIGMGGWA